jgi:chorismate mutase
MFHGATVIGVARLATVLRSVVVALAVGTLALPGASDASAAVSDGAAAGPARTGSGPPGPLRPLTDLVLRRIALADAVASAKFGTDAPIDDPAREQQVLGEVAASAPGAGVDPGDAMRFFRDQIEANKVVQRGLYARWSTHPELRPAGRPDLAAQVRPELDRITTELLEQLAATAEWRHVRAGCRPDRVAAQVPTDVLAGLDGLRRTALRVAMASVCTSH